jgi:hypothetical protein
VGREDEGGEMLTLMTSNLHFVFPPLERSIPPVIGHIVELVLFANMRMSEEERRANHIMSEKLISWGEK